MVGKPNNISNKISLKVITKIDFIKDMLTKEREYNLLSSEMKKIKREIQIKKSLINTS